jgi:hypothetical protein
MLGNFFINNCYDVNTLKVTEKSAFILVFKTTHRKILL